MMITRRVTIIVTVALTVIWFAAAVAMNYYGVWLLWRIVFGIVSIMVLTSVFFLMIEDE